MRRKHWNHNFVMTCDGKSASRAAGRRSANDICQRSIMLDKIEICRRKIFERKTEISDDRDGF